MLSRVIADVGEVFYNSDPGLAIALFGGAQYPGTPHRNATSDEYLTKMLPNGLAGESALIAAGCSAGDAKKIVKAAEAHLEMLKLKAKIGL